MVGLVAGLLVLVGALPALASATGGPNPQGFYWSATNPNAPTWVIDHRDRTDEAGGVLISTLTTPATPTGTYPEVWAFCDGVKAGVYYLGTHAGGLIGLTTNPSGLCNTTPGHVWSVRVGTVAACANDAWTGCAGTDTYPGSFIEMGRVDYQLGAAFTVTPTCTASQLADVAVGNGGGTTLSVRAKPSATWTSLAVYAPSGGSTATVTLTKADAVDGSPGYVYRTAAQTQAPADAKLTLFNGSVAVCSTTVVPINGSVQANGSTVGATDPGAADGSGGGGADCGLNPFCYVKSALAWAFVPPASTTQSVKAQWSEAGDHFPFALIKAGVSVGVAVSAVNWCDGFAGNNGCVWYWKVGGYEVFSDGSPGMSWLRSTEGQAVTGFFVYGGMLVALAMSVVWRLVPVAGSKGEDE